MPETKKRICYFCGKEITEKWDYNNADPLVAPDENGYYMGCCGDCNELYVKPARRILCPTVPEQNEKDIQELSSLIPYVQKMSLDELKNALDSKDPLAVFRTYKKKYIRRNGWWKKLFAITDRNNSM